MATQTELLRLRYELINKKFNRDVQDSERRVRKSAKGMTTATGRASKSFDGLNTSVAGIRTAMLKASFVAGVTVVAVDRLADRASNVTNLSIAFNTLTKRVGESSDEFLLRMRPATRGLVTDMELMKQANNAIILGLPITAKSMGELADIATTLGRAVGLGAVPALESLTTGIGRQSRMMLDNLGIIVDTKQAYDKYAKSIGVSTSQLTVQQQKLAFFNETMEQGRAKTQGLSDDTVTLAENWKVLTTRIINATNALLGWINTADPGFAGVGERFKVPGEFDPGPALGVFGRVGAVRTENRPDIPAGESMLLQENVDLADRLAAIMSEVTGHVSDASTELEGFFITFGELDEMARNSPLTGTGTPATLEELQAAMEALRPEFDAAIESVDLLNLSTIEMAEVSIPAWSEQVTEMTENGLPAMNEQLVQLTATQEALGQVTNQMALGFSQAAGAMLFAGLAGEKSSQSFKQVLSQLGRSAAAQALYELAIGWAATTPWGAAIYGPAPPHFKAAAIFGAAAVGLAVVSRAAGGGAGAGAGAGAGSIAPPIGPAVTPGNPPPRIQEFHIFLEGQGFVQSPEEFARTIAEITSSQQNQSGGGF